MIPSGFSTPESLRHLREHARNRTVNWRRKLIYWSGAVIVGLVAVGFAGAADWAAHQRSHIVRNNPWIMLLLAPAGLVLSTWMTRRWFRGAQGSGIPQAIACMHLNDMGIVEKVLSLRIALAKIGLTCLGLLAGASIGREGPTVQVGASIMHTVGRFAGVTDISRQRALVKAGAAAGVAAAFNTPLAGIVFGIEELAHSFEQRTSGTMLTCVIISGVTAIALVGNYTYFGHTYSTVPLGAGWLAVLACGLIGGLTGGMFSALLVRISRGIPGRAGAFITRRPLVFAALCGLALAIIGLLSDGMTYGTGYLQAREILMGSDHYHASFFLLKLLATLVSYCSGIPGGLFAPSLSVGAGMGGWIGHFLPHTPPEAVILLGTVAYFAAVTQAPLTATVIVMEMSDNQQITLALMASAFLAFGVSRALCSHALYSTLAIRFLRSAEPRKKAQASADTTTPKN
ncbi:chloride channel protein [Acetobacter vaccinii]|uniref:Chloride channel protein n=1 Tax=Acetobacter vaccinii TaxID=2592655 RepID=A0A5C1YK99_9PROT|nr:chloride channel protein [Acetobacter vaccinii]QEO16686.1 chloride channel protein [Acetobacter vaccinii]